MWRVWWRWGRFALAGGPWTKAVIARFEPFFIPVLSPLGCKALFLQAHLKTLTKMYKPRAYTSKRQLTVFLKYILGWLVPGVNAQMDSMFTFLNYYHIHNKYKS